MKIMAKNSQSNLFYYCDENKNIMPNILRKHFAKLIL